MLECFHFAKRLAKTIMPMKIESLSQTTIDNINKLPPTELRYYLFLLVAELLNEQNKHPSHLLLNEINEFTLAVDAFYRDLQLKKDPELSLDEVKNALNKLIEKAKLNTYSWKIKKILLDISACVFALVLGIIAASLGLVAGFFSQWNVFKGAYLGFMSGLCIGLIIGFRTPGKLFLSSWQAKLQSSLDYIEKISLNLEQLPEKNAQIENPETNPYFSSSYNYYENAAKKYILDRFFDEKLFPSIEKKEEAFKEFLQSEQCFEICTTQNGFLDKSLKGNLGNHALIRYKINEIKAPAMEFGPRTRYPNWTDQKESPRTVTGQKLFEMIALDLQLQETHAATMQFIWTSFKPGDNDCFTYVNKILLGTEQQPTQVKRFPKPIDTWIGHQVVGGLFKFFSKNQENELDVLKPFLKNENDQELTVEHFKRPG